MQKYNFIKKVEQMISPMDIATLQVISPLNKLLSRKWQNKIIASSGKKNPYMGFVVEPYSFFLCFEIIDQEYARQFLDDDFELEKVKIFNDDEPKYYCIFTCYNLHTSAFWGTRVEVNIIAKNKRSNLTSWIIIGCDTNALSHSIADGLVAATTNDAILTTDFNGNIILDIVNEKENRGIVADCSTKNAVWTPLNYKLWMEGNLSIGYGAIDKEKNGDVFSLKFDPKEVEYGFKIPLSDVNIDLNTWFHGLFNPIVEHAVYFPYAQHFISDSPGNYSKTKNAAEMITQMDNLDLESIPNYSAAPLRKMFKIGIVVNLLITWTIIITLIILLTNKW